MADKRQSDYAYDSLQTASRAFAIFAGLCLVAGFGCSQFVRFSHSIGYGYHDDFWRDLPAILAWSGGCLAVSLVFRWLAHRIRPH